MQVLFRAKEKNSNKYVIGYEYYNHVEDEYYITHYVSGSNYKVDITTRSINIEDMIDSENTRIFASLSKSGKGGDLVELLEGSKETMLCLMFKGRASYKDYVGRTHWWQHYDKVRVIGIQE